MPRPVERDHRYIPGLDGLRAVAVLCVILYHINAPWAKGGMLGVGVFFTLSGYVITDLLLERQRKSGSLGLGQFWLRRARRLLPALFLMLVVVSVLAALFDTSQLGSVRRQVISGAFYYANWSTIASHGTYFARFASPLPLDHLWSLSIEEQFYFIWPFIVFLAIRFLPGRMWLLLVTVVGTGLSAAWTAHLFHGGIFDPTRIYEGTDTRAFQLLLGAALAVMLPTSVRFVRERVQVRRVLLLDVLGVAGLVGIALLVWRTTPFTSFLYPYGLLLLSLSTVLVMLAVVHPASALGTLLGAPVLRWIGVRSYGIYLWQWPIVVLWGQPSTGVHWGRAALQVAVTLVVASLSWRFVEDPIRRGGLGRLLGRARVGASRLSEPRSAYARRAAFARRLTYAFAAVALAAVAVTSVSLAGALPGVSSGHSPSKISAIPQITPSHDPSLRIRILKPATHTACRSVVYIGDSTSEGQISTSYIPRARHRLDAFLARVGVKRFYPEISGARSIVETYQGFPSAQTVASNHIAAGYHGCWIFALGTNEAADVAVGSSVGLRGRIDLMMHAVRGQPVLWIDSITLLSSGPYAETQMEQWNNALLAACKRYPNMRVFDWAAHAKRRWFISDGTHYYSPGYVARNKFISRGLVKAFPRGQPASATCLVR
jgi:peptidoglycan/LPS O-acetylase OafA/YrhL